jgi:hypothetical protein
MSESKSVSVKTLESTEAAESASSRETTAIQKIPIVLRPIGSAPLLTKNKFHLSGTRQIIEVERYLRKTLEKDIVNKGLFLYCGGGFSPTPDQYVQDLYECFNIGGDLVVMYGIQEQYG